MKGSSALVIHGMEKETSLKNLSAVTSLTAAYGAEIGSGSCPELFPVRYSNCLRASHYAYLCYLIVLDQCLLFMLLGVVSFQGLNFRPCHIKKNLNI